MWVLGLVLMGVRSWSSEGLLKVRTTGRVNPDHPSKTLSFFVFFNPKRTRAEITRPLSFKTKFIQILQKGTNGTAKGQKRAALCAAKIDITPYILYIMQICDL